MKRITLTQWMLGLTPLAVCLGVSPSPTAAQTLFLDDFEGDLTQWVGKGGGAHSGIVVEDPLRPGNHVVTFTELTGEGDIFGSEVSVTPGQKYRISFEYLGIPNLGGLPDNLGGFIGFSEDTPGFQRWLAGTILCCGAEDDPLIDDGEWHRYTIEFDPFVDRFGNPRPPSNNTIRLMLEDHTGFGGVPGDVFFDNARLALAPIEVVIDIKPGSDPNSINCNNEKGVIPVAILSSDEFDATTVDHTTVHFGKTGTEAMEIHTAPKTAEPKRHEEDVDDDGDTDLVFHFRFGETGIECGDTEAILTGETFDGQEIRGTDGIRTVGRSDSPLPTVLGSSLPTFFTLNQNYPNPFPSTTFIQYILPKDSRQGIVDRKVSLKIYDIRGQLVQTLIDEPQESGVYIVKWEGKNLSSGIYFYRLTVGELGKSSPYTTTRKMILLR